MKNFLLIFFTQTIFYSLTASNSELSSCCRNSDSLFSLLEDSVVQYYLVNTDLYRINQKSIQKRISRNQAIIGDFDLTETQKKNSIKLSGYQWKWSNRAKSGFKGSSTKSSFAIQFSGKQSFRKIEKYQKLKVLKRLTSYGILIVESDFEFLDQNIIPLKEVIYVDILNRTAVEESPIRQYSPDANRINTAWHAYPNARGDEIVLSLKENAIIPDDIDLRGKIIIDEMSAPEFTQHAKEMGTLIAGAGFSSYTANGIVPKAKIVCTDFLSLFAEEESYYTERNVSIQNHSYGTGIENFYGTETFSYDQSVINQPELVHVFSSGNAGTLTAEFGTYKELEGYANLTGNFKQAKNAIVVTALDSALQVVSLVSNGPAYDGRLKPELAAFGAEGTSESAALVSGAAGMLQGRYQESHDQLPPSALIKALLIAGARDVHTPGIDFKTGYGSLNLKQSMDILTNENYTQDVLTSNESKMISLEVPANCHELKVVLVWTDPPANPEDALALVNDLDLKVEAPDSQSWLPWVLNTDPNLSALAALPTRSADHLNNTEMVTVDNPEAGTYSIQVAAGDLKDAVQEYALVYTYSIANQFEWTYPTGSDQLVAGSSPYFRWDSSHEGNGQISINYGGETWFPVGSTDVSSGQLKYLLPATSTQAVLRMEIGGDSFFSDPFTISESLNLEVANDCTHEFILSWNRLSQTESYRVYELRDSFMALLTEVSDTSIVLSKSFNTYEYYAVQPVHTAMSPGIRGDALDYANQNKGCFLTSFLAFIDINDKAQVSLSINVPSNINSITIYKEFQRETDIFQQFSPDTQNEFIFEDTAIEPGRNAYYASVEVEHGPTIYSDTLNVYYTDEQTIVVFPNPVVGEDYINVINAFPGGSVELLDSKGNSLQFFDLVNNIEAIDLTGLRKGMYYFRIIYEDRIVNSGKIIRH